MEEPLINSLLAIVCFVCLFGVSYLPYVRNVIEFETHTKLSTGWFVFSILTLLYLVDTYNIFSLENIWWKVLWVIASVILVMYFSRYWQDNGREYIPRRSKYVNEVATFYDFTPRYAFVKALDIFFQNVTAAVVIMALYTYTGSVLETGLYFGLLFFVTHAVTIILYGFEWAILVVLLSFVAAVIPVVIITQIPAGILLLFSFHYLVYAVFLLVLGYIYKTKDQAPGRTRLQTSYASEHQLL